MQVETLSLENQVELTQLINSYQQLLPFFYSQDRARKNFLANLVKLDTAQFSLVKEGEVLAIVSYKLVQKVLTITDLFIKPSLLNHQGSLAFWFVAVEKEAKKLGAQSLCLNVLDVDMTLAQRLEKLGFVINQLDHGNLLAKKDLDYHTALVLAGGGARGAYQIGVWRALRELRIDYKIITGTSVGALNGALIAQGDFSVAEEMWSAIETEQILSYPHQEKEKAFTPMQMIKEVQQFAQSALTNQGVSTAPLAALIQRLLDEDKLLAAGIDLYLCTTELPSVKERVVSLKEVEPGTYKDWLLASSSFFPAMAATKIDEHFYVDGGYRNNIPVDVALKAGGTELIVLDVKGPGLTKASKVPNEIPQRIIASPWSLGTVLLFDGARSHWNLELGYLEGLKAFGRYRGYWYTYQGNFSQATFRQEVAFLLNQFKHTLTVAEKEIFNQQELINNLSRRISPLYQERLTESGLFLYLLELVAKIVEVKPTKLYNLSDLIIVIKAQVEGLGETKQSTTQAEMLLSLAEWGKRLLAELPLPLENQQIHYIATIITEVPDDPSLLILAKLAPINYLTAKLLTQIQSLELVVAGSGER